MPRKKFWRRGAVNKKGNSHPSNHGLTLDSDLGRSPVKKAHSDDLGRFPVKKAQSDGLGMLPSKAANLSVIRDCETNSVQPHCETNSVQTHSETNSVNKLGETNSVNKLCDTQFESEACQDERVAHPCHVEKTSSENSGQAHDVSETENTYFASHNQADTMYSSFSRGSQCTCMSLSMILSLQDETCFSTNALDLVLHHGDNLYRKIVLDLQNTGKFRNSLLSFDELPLALQ